MKRDLLRMDFINDLSMPLMAEFYGGDQWPIEDIDVQTGLLRIDVVGKRQVKHVGDLKHIIDADGRTHAVDELYTEDSSKFLCKTCGIGYILPSGRCDHCDTLEFSDIEPDQTRCVRCGERFFDGRSVTDDTCDNCIAF